MTRAKSDYEKALDRAARAYAAYMTDVLEEADPHQLALLQRDLTIVAHWDEQEHECECPVCLAP